MPAHRSVLAARLKTLGRPDLDGSYGRGGIVVKLPEESRKELEPLLDILLSNTEQCILVEEAQEGICCEEFIDFANKYRLMLKLIRMAYWSCVAKPEELRVSFWSAINCGRK
ncbi:hypothetical protein WN943_023899 [Citrus x changshan-huyou]